MLNLQVALQFVMLALWYLAASVGGAAMGLRWVALALSVPVALLVRMSAARTTRLPSGWGVLLLLGVYGVVLGTVSRAPALAITKSVVFTATTLTFVAGGVALVERFGRDRVLSAWRNVWRILLLFSLASSVLGRWRSGPEGLYGPTGNPNMFGSILFSVGLILTVPSPHEARWTRLVELAGGAAVLLATRSRASLVAALAAALVALLLHRGRARWAWAATILVVSASVLVLRPDRAAENVVSVTEGATLRDMASTRLATWAESWDAMQDGLPLGFGWGVKAGPMPDWNFDVRSLGYGREEGTSWLPIGEELGLPGFLLFGWLWVLLAGAVRRTPWRPQVVGGAALAGYFVLATFEGWLLSPGNWESAAFWTTMGILFARPAAVETALAPPTLASERVPLGGGVPP